MSKFKCPTCHSEIKDASNFARHMREAHSGFKYPCPLCSEKFLRLYLLKAHTIRAHNVQITDAYIEELDKRRMLHERHNGEPESEERLKLRRAMERKTFEAVEAAQLAVDLRREEAAIALATQTSAPPADRNNNKHDADDDDDNAAQQPAPKKRRTYKAKTVSKKPRSAKKEKQRNTANNDDDDAPSVSTSAAATSSVVADTGSGNNNNGGGNGNSNTGYKSDESTSAPLIVGDIDGLRKTFKEEFGIAQLDTEEIVQAIRMQRELRAAQRAEEDATATTTVPKAPQATSAVVAPTLTPIQNIEPDSVASSATPTAKPVHQYKWKDPTTVPGYHLFAEATEIFRAERTRKALAGEL